MKKIILGALILGAFTFTSCGSDDEATPPSTPPNSNITYDGNVESIIASNCLGCHGNPTSNGAPSSFNTYSLVKTGVQSGNILNRINNTTNPMPPNGLMSQSNRDIIQQWLDDGLLEN